MAGKVRILKEKLFKVKKDDTKLLYVEGACDNDATPPQGNFVTGSAFENVTSGNKYKYSETSGDWVLQPNEGGGGSASINVTDVPYLAQALQTAVTTAVTTGVTSHANQPFYYNSIVRDENLAANMETLISFLTDNEGSALYLASDGAYNPLTYRADTGYVSFKMKGTGTGYAYDLDVEIVKMTQAETPEIVGAAFSIYGFATTNV